MHRYCVRPRLQMSARGLRVRTGDSVQCGMAVAAAILWSCIAAGTAHAQCAASFGAGVNFPTGTQPWSVAAADLNNDGRLDLVTANSVGNSVAVLLGSGAGTFSPQVFYAVGNSPQCVAVGDLNGDGRPDLVTANLGGHAISVLLGFGDGTFGPRVDLMAGVQSPYVAIGDMNGDGRPDLVVANTGSNGITVLLGNGNGSFAPPINTGVGVSINCVAIGDINGDGRADLAAANFTTVVNPNVRVLLGNGDGTFAGAVSYSVASRNLAVAMGDLNGDGKPDLAVANSMGTSASILLGNGDGTFAPRVDYPLHDQAYSIAIGDLNGDGRPDIASANIASEDVSVLLGAGDGTFAAPVQLGAGAGTVSVAMGDFNNDGKPDLAAANAFSHNVTVRLNTGGQAAITQHPSDQSVAAGQGAVFSVATTGATALQWRRNGVPLSNNGRISGVTSGTMSIAGVTAADAGVYDVRLVGGCNSGRAVSRGALLTIEAACPADFDHSGTLGVPDVFAFLSAWFAGCP